MRIDWEEDDFGGIKAWMYSEGVTLYREGGIRAEIHQQHSNRKLYSLEVEFYGHWVVEYKAYDLPSFEAAEAELGKVLEAENVHQRSARPTSITAEAAGTLLSRFRGSDGTA